MKSETIMRFAVRFYIGVFFVYLFTPLIIMGLATFNDSRFPTVSPWKGATLKWFEALAQDGGMWTALWTSILVAAGVLVVAVPIGICCALFLSTVQG
ncbi:MAG: ABC transporter permease, partial [Lentilitoribacter sp.]